jgi:mRNA interferase RelE/StbE
MNNTVNINEAKTDLAQLLNKISQNGERYVIQKKNKPIAVIISTKDFKVLECIEEQIDAKFLRESVEFSSYEFSNSSNNTSVNYTPQHYKLDIHSKAMKDIAGLPTKQYKQILSKILSLQANPRPNDCKRPQEYKIGYSVDQGEYRILYTVDDKQKMVNIHRVRNRNDDEAYQRM